MPAAAFRPTARRLTLLLLLAATLAAAPAVPAAPTAGPGTPELLHTFGPLGYPSIFSTLRFGSRLYLSAYEESSGVQLWRTDGTPASTVPLSDLTGNSVVDSLQSTAHGGVFFGANPAGVGYELFYSAGQPGDAQLTHDFLGASDGLTGYPAVLGDVAYFSARVDNNNHYELWRSDGTLTGTTQVLPVSGGGFYPLDDLLLFRGGDADGAELWRSDGTPGGTMPVADLWDGPTSSSPTMRLAWHHWMFFTATTEDTGTELWITNGTAAGTTLVRDVASGNASSQINIVRDSGLGWAYFVANDGVHGAEMWRTDGTPAGTFLLSDIYPGLTSSSPDWFSFTSVDNQAFFPATDPDHGTELWRTDGTPEGTLLVRDLYTGTTGSGVKALAAHNGLLYFSANDGVHGQELWRTDGTPGGTELVADIVPDAVGANPAGLTWAYKWLLFAATDTANGRELWVSDGLPGGDTHLLANLEPAGAGSNPAGFSVYGDQVYFYTRPDLSQYEGLWGLTVTPFDVVARVYLPALQAP